MSNFFFALLYSFIIAFDVRILLFGFLLTSGEMIVIFALWFCLKVFWSSLQIDLQEISGILFLCVEESPDYYWLPLLECSAIFVKLCNPAKFEARYGFPFCSINMITRWVHWSIFQQICGKGWAIEGWEISYK